MKMNKGLGLLLFLAGFLFSCSSTTSLIGIEGNRILVEGKVFQIKGICYHPVPKGSDKRDFSNIEEDLKLMKDAGINTIRVYEPIAEREVLDKINEANVKVVIGFGYNQNGKYDILSGSFIDYVEKFKNHNAILMWELGNEYNYHPDWFDGNILNWYEAMETAAKEIKKIDTSHPVTTAHGELPKISVLGIAQSIDVWGMNVYRWDDPSSIFEEWKELSDKPMYLSEAGGDSYMTITKEGYEKGFNEKAQADANEKILKAIFENEEVCSGVTLFSFTDGWWKAGNSSQQDVGGWAPNSSGVPYDGSPNEEFWGIVDIDRNKKMAFDVVKKMYTTKEVQ